MSQITECPSSTPIYLDYAASTPPAPEVVEAMLPWLQQRHANPHSAHWHGQRASRVVDDARQAIADLIDGEPEGVILTSGATEANNLAVKGFLARGRRSVWLSDIEHKSLLEPARVLEVEGRIQVHGLTVNADGEIDSHALDRAMAASTLHPSLVAIGHGNNEIGTIQVIAPLAEIIHKHGGYLHLDASQTAAHVALSVCDDGIDLVCLSSHKMYGPAGIGALYVEPSLLVELTPMIHGGGQQSGLRSGTIAPFLAAGFGEAARLARRAASVHRTHLAATTTAFLRHLVELGVTFDVLGAQNRRVPGHLSLKLYGVAADDVLTRLFAVLSASTGAACDAGHWKASHVLRAMGLNEDSAERVIRVTFGRDTSLCDVQTAAQQLAAVISSMH